MRPMGYVNGDGVLRAPIRFTFGTALRMCREKRGFTVRDVAENINVPLADVLLWEDDKAFPSHIKTVRLIGMMPQMRHYKLLIPKISQDKADKSEPEQQATEPQPQSPPPAAPAGPPKDFREALVQLKHSSRQPWMKLGETAGLSGSGIGMYVSGKRDVMSPSSYNALCAAYPQLKDAPPPSLGFGRGKWTTEEAEALGLLARPLQPLPEELLPTQKLPAEPQSEPAAAPKSMEQLARDYAEAATVLSAANKHAEATWEAALAADEEKKTAEAAAQIALEALQRAVGLIK